MRIEHEYINTYLDLIREADGRGRIAVAMNDYQVSTGYSMSRLEAMPLDERCGLLVDAVFVPFVPSLHKYVQTTVGDGIAALEPQLHMTQDLAVLEFNLAPALGLPGADPAAELAELHAFFEHWTVLYRRYATLRGGTVRIWSAGSSCDIDWSRGDSGIDQASAEAISKDLAKRVAASRILAAWIARIGQGLCFYGQYCRYCCSPQDILGEEEAMLLPSHLPR